MPVKRWIGVRTLLACLGASLLVHGGAVSAAPGTLNAQLTVFFGDGAGTLTAQPTLHYSAAFNGPSLPISIASNAFSATLTTPVATVAGGPIPFPANNMIFVIGHEIQQSNLAGSFGPGQAPAGGFGGTLALGATIKAFLGFAPLSNTFGSVTVPLGIGASGTQSNFAAISGNVISVSAMAGAWTTGAVQFGSGFATSGTVSGAYQASTTTPGVTRMFVQELSLVSPFSFRVDHTQTNNGQPLAKAGYALLSIQVSQVPEPALGILLAATCLLWQGRRKAHRG